MLSLPCHTSANEVFSVCLSVCPALLKIKLKQMLQMIMTFCEISGRGKKRVRIWVLCGSECEPIILCVYDHVVLQLVERRSRHLREPR